MKKTQLKRKTPLMAKAHSRKRQTRKAEKPRSWYTKRLDEIAKRFAKERDGYICQLTGEQVTGANAHGSHVIPVSAGIALRWDLNNIKCLSYHSHINWWHKNPLDSGEWFATKFPERHKYLHERRNITLRISTCDLAEFYSHARSCETWEDYEAAYSESMGPLLQPPGGQ